MKEYKQTSQTASDKSQMKGHSGDDEGIFFGGKIKEVGCVSWENMLWLMEEIFDVHNLVYALFYP